MGWTTMPNSRKQDVIDHVTRLQENESGVWKTIAKCVSDNVLWAVVDVFAKADGAAGLAAGQSLRFIACYRLGRDQGYGWGYRDMCESMGPYYYNCPLRYLEMAPEQCPEWRAKVRAWHAQRKGCSAWKAGDQVVCNGHNWNPYILLEPYRKHSQARKSGWIVQDKWGVKWRLSSHQMKNAERVVDDLHKPSLDIPEPEQMGLL